MMPADKAQNYIEFLNKGFSSGNTTSHVEHMGSATVSLWAVESYQEQNGSISTRASNKLNTWQFELKYGSAGDGHPCQHCQYYGYGASHCYDTTCYTATDPHFVLGTSAQ
jgi:hypothetical protein